MTARATSPAAMRRRRVLLVGADHVLRTTALVAFDPIRYELTIAMGPAVAKRLHDARAFDVVIVAPGVDDRELDARVRVVSLAAQPDAAMLRAIADGP
jgi:hypothetical protein